MSRTFHTDIEFVGGAKPTGLPTPTNPSDAAPKSYVDGLLGNPTLTETSPTAASANTVKLTGLDEAGRTMVGFRDADNPAAALQPALFDRNAFTSFAMGTTNNLGGTGSLTVTGTATARAMATTNLFTAARRVGYVSAATANSSAAVARNERTWWRGNAAGLGGFFFAARFGISDAAAVADATTFCGLANAFISDTAPASRTNFVGLAHSSGQTTWRIMHNDGSGVATEIDLGANFPCDTRSTDLYDVRFYCAPNGSSIFYRVERLNTGDVATGEITTDLPANTSFLCAYIQRRNGATALAVAFDFCSLYVESNY